MSEKETPGRRLISTFPKHFATILKSAARLLSSVFACAGSARGGRNGIVPVFDHKIRIHARDDEECWIEVLHRGFAGQHPCFCQICPAMRPDRLGGRDLLPHAMFRANAVSRASRTIWIVRGSGAQGNMSLTSDTVDGNVALGHGTTHSFVSTTITGSTTTLQGGDPANADAKAAATTAKGLATTGSIPGNHITGTTTFTGQAGQNVVDLTSINLTGATFTISGNSTETFVFNLSGTMSLTNHSSIALAGGVTANHVVFNLTGQGNSASFTNSNVNGTVLAMKSSDSITVSGGTSNGAFMSKGSISITNDEFTADPFTAPRPRCRRS